MLVKRIGGNRMLKSYRTKDLPNYGNRSNGRINPKYLNGIKGIRGKLEAQSHTIVEQGKQFLLEDLQRKTVIPKFK